MREKVLMAVTFKASVANLLCELGSTQAHEH